MLKGKVKCILIYREENGQQWQEETLSRISSYRPEWLSRSLRGRESPETLWFFPGEMRAEGNKTTATSAVASEISFYSRCLVHLLVRCVAVEWQEWLLTANCRRPASSLNLHMWHGRILLLEIAGCPSSCFCPPAAVGRHSQRRVFFPPSLCRFRSVQAFHL